MSLLNTKPRYFPTAEATESGWINPVTKELLVSVGGLKSKLALEAAQEVLAPIDVAEPIVVDVAEPIVVDVAEPIVVDVPIELIDEPKEIIMEEITPVKVRKEYTKKVKVVTEETTKKVSDGQQLLGEVVEYDLDKPVIGE